jgi:hypothetical protein
LRVAFLLAAVLAVIGSPRTSDAEPIEIHARQVVMSFDNPDVERVDRLIFRGGIDLTSPDRRFGGLSALDVSPDGTRMVAVGDRGIWFRATLVYSRKGELRDAKDGEILPLLGVDGQPFKTKSDQDSESIARLTDGSYVVGFERRHRLRLYTMPGSAARRMASPPVLRTSPPHRGAEAITPHRGNELLILSEGLEARPGIAAGWIGSGRDWRAVGLCRSGIYLPVGLATRDDDGAVFLLERRFTTLGGIGSRISIIDPRDIGPGKIFEGRELGQIIPPLIADNFEGISVRRDRNGDTLIYVVSDDNFNDLQRTYLLMFALAE